MSRLSPSDEQAMLTNIVLQSLNLSVSKDADYDAFKTDADC